MIFKIKNYHHFLNFLREQQVHPELKEEEIFIKLDKTSKAMSSSCCNTVRMLQEELIQTYNNYAENVPEHIMKKIKKICGVGKIVFCCTNSRNEIEKEIPYE